jgi:GNAT superfamily N-acetyltransferase
VRKIIGLSMLDRESLPVECAGCVFWETATRLPFECGSRCDDAQAVEWVRTVSAEWGECGRAVVEDGETMGFIKYAPPVYLPQARHLQAGPPEAGVPLIACMHIAPNARRAGVGGLLLRAAMRDLAMRGERSVQAYAITGSRDLSHMPVVGVEFLLRHGFTVSRPHPETPLLRVDLKTLASWTENLEAVLESLKIPLRAPRGEPVTLARGDR